jgi:uncharacterized membrane protein
MVTTLVTYLVDPQCYIRFGVLHMFGVSMLLYAVLHRLSGERQYGERAAGIAAVCFAAGFLVCFPIWNGGLGLYQWIVFKLPAAFYASDFLFWLGFPSARFVSADYYPLLPWSLLFLSGACLGQLANRTPDWMKKSRLSGLSFIGKHTMFLYLLHQPAYYLIFWLIAACKGRA